MTRRAPAPDAPHASRGRPRKKAPAPRARLDVDERRAQLLALGLAMFSERTYDEVSIDDLARAAGVSKGLYYYYFQTKRDLYVAALGEAARRLLDETRTDPDTAPGERLRRGLLTYLDFVERHGQAYVALMRGGIGSDPEVAAILEETRGTFVARLLEGLPGETFHDNRSTGAADAAGATGADARPPAQAKRPLVRTALRGWIGFVEATAIDWMDHHAVRREDLVELLAGVIVDAVTRAMTVADVATPNATDATEATDATSGAASGPRKPRVPRAPRPTR